MNKKICPICESTFTPKGRHRKYCSDKCAYERYLQKAKEYRENPHKKVLAEMICPVCGSAFTPHTYSQKYCSPECSHTAQIQKMREWRHSKMICPVCGKTFIAKHSNQICCSETCQKELMLDEYPCKGITDCVPESICLSCYAERCRYD